MAFAQFPLLGQLCVPETRSPEKHRLDSVKKPGGSQIDFIEPGGPQEASKMGGPLWSVQGPRTRHLTLAPCSQTPRLRTKCVCWGRQES